MGEYDIEVRRILYVIGWYIVIGWKGKSALAILKWLKFYRVEY